MVMQGGAAPAASGSRPAPSALLKRRLREGFQGSAQGAVCAWNLHVSYRLSLLSELTSWYCKQQEHIWERRGRPLNIPESLVRHMR